ncbi:PAS domain S-box protein [Jhaorihella thermophila]|uniref:PAS domain S-box protein n=1 Tax=Jhaorihella thermophila TaxID=488547 RepID=UPI001F43C203|nr:PAS domain S-box protein [Jhaorihella thermophila]
MIAATLSLIMLMAGAAAVRAQTLAAPQPAEITIGVRAHLGREQAIARWQPTVKYLNANFPDKTFRLRTYDSPEAIEQAAAEGEFDYVITDPGSFAVMDVKYGVEERLTLVNAWQGRPVTRFGSVIFTRADRTDIRGIDDLSGQDLMAVSPRAFGGWLVAVPSLQRAGRNPDDFHGGISFAGGNQQTVVRAVLSGRVDAGVVRTGTLERMAHQGLIDLNEVHVIGARTVPGFPFALSTELYPEWAFAESPKAPDSLRAPLLAALTAITPDHPAAIAGSYMGWQNVADYWPVHELLKELKAPPYSLPEEARLGDVLRRNSRWIALVALGILAGYGLLLFLLRKRSIAVDEQTELARLADSERLVYREALDRHAIVSLSDANGIITDVNQRFVEVSGFTREEIVGQSHSILRTELVPPETYEEMWATLRRGEIWSGELANRRKDGGVWWVQTTVAPRFDAKGRIRGFVSVRTDVTALKAAQAEMNLRQYLECTPGEVFIFAADSYRITFANGTAQKVAGMSDADLTGRTLFDFMSDEDAARLRRLLQMLAKENGAPISFACERIMPDGRRIETSYHIQYLAPHGIAPRFVANLHDITDETDVRNLVTELSNTLDTVSDQIFMFWPDTKRFFYANRAAKLHFGLADEDIRQLTPSDLVVGLSPEECDAVLKPILEGDSKQKIFRREIDLPDGSVRVMEYDIRYVQPKGRKPRFIAILRDRTEQAQAEAELRQLRVSLDLIEDEIYMFWPGSYAFTYMSRNALERVGWGADGWRGRHTWDYITDKQQKWLEEKCAALIRGPERSMVFETRDRDGRNLEVYLHLIKPENDRPRFLSIYRDITEKKQAETAKSQFLATVSHELRTPLTSIKGSLGLIKAGIDKMDPDRLTRMLDIAYMNADRLHALINDILDWEKIEAGEMTYALDDLDLGSALREAVEMNQGYARQHGVTFRLAAPRSQVICRADKLRIQQVVSNLLSNAAKFSGADKTVEVTLTCEGAEAEVAVRDHGDGIPEEARPTIFNRFTQADSSDVRRKGGTGLGLSISKAIVEAHGGTIGFDCPGDGGTRFYFRLPLKQPEQRPETPKDRDNGPCVLICERDAERAMEIWFALERAGLKCSVARSLAQLDEQADTDAIDCLVLNRDLGPAAQSWIAEAVQYQRVRGDRVVFYSDGETVDDLTRKVVGATSLRSEGLRPARRVEGAHAAGTASARKMPKTDGAAPTNPAETARN